MGRQFVLNSVLYYRIRLRKALRQIVTDGASAVWPDLIRKQPNCSSAELREYLHIRAAQVAYPKLQASLQQYSGLSSDLADRLLKITTKAIQDRVNTKLATHLKSRNRKVA